MTGLRVTAFFSQRYSQVARQNLSPETTIEKLDKYHLIILDDLCSVRKDQAETSVLFELIAARYGSPRHAMTAR